MRNFLPYEACPIRDVLGGLGDKWSLLVLMSLGVNGTMRFSDLGKSIGDISQRMLTVTLRALEADGLVSRKVFAEVPPRVEYRLTERGESFLPHLDSLVEWARSNMPAIVDSRRKCGKCFTTKLIHSIKKI